MEQPDHILQPLSIFKNEDISILLLVLNQPISSQKIFEALWKRASFKVCCDGGANRLHDFSKSISKPFVADVITGDGDSLREEVKEDFAKQGCPFVHLPDQDSTDFTKSAMFAMDHCKAKKIKYDVIVAYPAMNGRLDHVMSNINTLFLLEDYAATSYLLSDQDIVCLIKPGVTNIMSNTGMEGEYCGLIPIGSPSVCVTTKGLKYNVENDEFRFGGLISTSNSIQQDCDHVMVKTSSHLLWTLNFVLR